MLGFINAAYSNAYILENIRNELKKGKRSGTPRKRAPNTSRPLMHTHLLMILLMLALSVINKVVIAQFASLW